VCIISDSCIGHYYQYGQAISRATYAHCLQCYFSTGLSIYGNGMEVQLFIFLDYLVVLGVGLDNNMEDHCRSHYNTAAITVGGREPLWGQHLVIKV